MERGQREGRKVRTETIICSKLVAKEGPSEPMNGRLGSSAVDIASSISRVRETKEREWGIGGKSSEQLMGNRRSAEYS